MTASQIADEFLSLLRQAGRDRGFIWSLWHQSKRRNSRNIVELSGSVDCLLYFKIRSEEPPRWGVTANRINELEQSRRKWFLVLLFSSPHNGYFITAEEVMRYLAIWPRGNDGDFKVQPGPCLEFSTEFPSFSKFLDRMISACEGG